MKPGDIFYFFTIIIAITLCAATDMILSLWGKDKVAKYRKKL